MDAGFQFSYLNWKLNIQPNVQPEWCCWRSLPAYFHWMRGCWSCSNQLHSQAGLQVMSESTTWPQFQDKLCLDGKKLIKICINLLRWIENTKIFQTIKYSKDLFQTFMESHNTSIYIILFIKTNVLSRFQLFLLHKSCFPFHFHKSSYICSYHRFLNPIA